MSRTIRDIKHAKMLRHPKTQSEKRLVAAALEDGIKVRPKRNTKHLPDTYDDLEVVAKREIVEKVLDAPGLF